MAISEFQLSLIGAGAVAVGAVWAYNIWQEYRHRKTAQRIFAGHRTDALLPEEGAEAPVAAMAAQERIEPLIGLPEPAAEVPPPAIFDEGWLDEVIEVGFQLPPEREPFMVAWQERSAAFHKRIRWVVRNDGNGEWNGSARSR